MSRVEKVRQVVQNFYRQQEEYNESKKKFEKSKKTFEEFMNEHMATNKVVVESDSLCEDCKDIVVTKVTKTHIEWFPDKLEKRIEKKVAKEVIKKHYYIADMQGLVKYLKSCGVNPKIFAKYLLIEKQVDQDAVGRLGESGKITPRNISGCYIVKCSKPYFKLSLRKRANNGGECKS